MARSRACLQPLVVSAPAHGGAAFLNRTINNEDKSAGLPICTAEGRRAAARHRDVPSEKRKPRFSFSVSEKAMDGFFRA
jgi:hypothetical protein